MRRALGVGLVVFLAGCGSSREDPFGPGGSGGSSAAGGASAAGGSSAGSGGVVGQGGAGNAGSGGGTTSVPPPEPVGCVTDVSSGDHRFDCNGVVHYVTVPTACLTSLCGLVIDVHGGTMDAQMENNNTDMREIGSQHGFVVIQPSAPNNLWTAATDDPKVFAFMMEVVQAWHLDRKRLHMMGFSQGGYMSWRFVCQHSDVFASAAPAAAALQPVLAPEVPCNFTGSDAPAQELDLLYMHGTQDALVNFQNGITQRDAVIARFGLGAPEEVKKTATYRHTRYTNAKGTVFEFVDHDYVTDSAVGVPPLGVAIRGHCYPGSTDLVPSVPGQLMAFGCKTPPSEFHWGKMAVEFFIAHPKR